MGPFVNSVACLQKDHKKYPNLFCFVWLVNPEDSEKGLDIFWVWISEEIQTFGFFPISKPKKYPNLFLNLPDLQAIQNRKGLDIF